MKKLKPVILMIVIALTFSSCISDDTEIKNRLIIEGIGIDFDTEKEEYLLTVQALSTSSAGADDQGGAASPVVNYSVKGKTVVSALNSLCENTGRYPLYSQNRVIVIGSSLPYGKIAPALDYLVREYTARPDVYVAAATGAASDILTVQANGEIPAKTIEESIDESNTNSLALNTRLYNVVNLYSEKTTSFTLPLLEIDESRNTPSKTVKVTGTWAMTKEGQKNHLSSEETVMLKFITDDIQLGTISLSHNKKQAGLDIINSKTKVSVRLRDGIPHFEIRIRCSLDLVEYGSPDFGSIDLDEVKALQSTAESYITSGVREILTRQLKTEKCDIFRFGRYLQQTYPEIYTRLANNWDEALQSFTFEVSTDAVLRKIGQETLKSNHVIPTTAQ